jgi:hypothetical protein
MADDLTLFHGVAKLASMVAHEARSLFLRLDTDNGIAVLVLRLLPRLATLSSMVGGADAEIFAADLGELDTMERAAVIGPDLAKKGDPPLLNDSGAPFESRAVFLTPLGKALDGLAALGTVGSLAEATPLLRDVILQLGDTVVITWGPIPSTGVTNTWQVPPRETR